VQHYIILSINSAAIKLPTSREMDSPQQARNNFKIINIALLYDAILTAEKNILSLYFLSSEFFDGEKSFPPMIYLI